MGHVPSPRHLPAARHDNAAVEFGADRAINGLPNWPALSSQQLYQSAVVDNNPGDVETLAQTWREHGQVLQQVATDVGNMGSNLDGVWTGEGSSAAKQMIASLAQVSSRIGHAALLMGDKLSQQADAAAEVKKLPQPREFDAQQSTLAMLTGGPVAMLVDNKIQADAANEVKAQQVAYLNTYTTQLSEIDSVTPSFAAGSLGLPTTSTEAEPRISSVSTVSAHAFPGGNGLVVSPTTNAGVVVDSPEFSSAQSGNTQPAHYSPAAIPSSVEAVSGTNTSTKVHAGLPLGIGAIGTAFAYIAKKLRPGNRSASARNNETLASSTTLTGTASGAVVSNKPLNSGDGMTPSHAGQHNPANTGYVGNGSGPVPMTAAPGTSGVVPAPPIDKSAQSRRSILLPPPDADNFFGDNRPTVPPVIGGPGDPSW